MVQKAEFNHHDIEAMDPEKQIREKAFRGAIALGLICVGFVAINLTCVALDRTPLMLDSLGVYQDAWGFSQSLLHDGPARWDMLLQPGHKPPLLQVLAGLVMTAGVFLRSHEVPILLEQLFFILLLFSVYFAARRMAPKESPSISLLAAVVTGACPIVFGMSKTLMNDLPMAAMVWAGFALLLHSDRFTRLRHSLAFGIICGIGLFLKQTFFLFMAPAAFLYVAVSLFDGRETGKKARNIALAGFASLLIAGPWYFRNVMASFSNNLADNRLPTSFADLTINAEYFRRIWGEQTGVVIALLAVLGAIRIVADPELRRRYGKWLAIGAFCLLIPYVYLSSVPFKLSRFGLPWVPILTLTLAIGLLSPGRLNWPRKALGIAVALFCAVQFLFMSFTTMPWHQPRTGLEAFFGFPEHFHEPGGTNVGVFRIRKAGIEQMLVEQLARERLGHPARLLIINNTDAAFGESTAISEIRCLPHDFPAQVESETVFAWPELVLVVQPCYRCASTQTTELNLGTRPGYELAHELLNENGHFLIYLNRFAPSQIDPPLPKGNCG
jgi:Dolichyl-phosphate-mannose-protein mannosyltransferase